MKPIKTTVARAPRNVLATSTMTEAPELVDECRETLVGRTFGVRSVQLHGDGLGIRIHLGRRGT
jgi:hypothetical protein